MSFKEEERRHAMKSRTFGWKEEDADISRSYAIFGVLNECGVIMKSEPQQQSSVLYTTNPLAQSFVLLSLVLQRRSIAHT